MKKLDNLFTDNNLDEKNVYRLAKIGIRIMITESAGKR